MAYEFDVDVAGDPAGVLGRVKKVAEERGGTLEGDAESGTFSGQGVFGTYRIEGARMRIALTAKPFFLTWPAIETAVRSFFK